MCFTSARAAISIVSVAVLLGAASNTHASLLTNGDFSSSAAGQLTVNGSLSGWTGHGKEGNFGSQTAPPVFVFNPGTSLQLSTLGENGDSFMGNVKFYGATAAPDGGVVVSAIGDSNWAGGISQAVSGLTPGTSYTLTFNWAGAQQQGFSGPTIEDWSVAFGSSTQSTSTVVTPSQSFSGWQSATMTFTADASSDLLNFTAVGLPSGLTPTLLLDNVSLNPTAVPEPATLGLLSLGGIGLLTRRRRRMAV